MSRSLFLVLVSAALATACAPNQTTAEQALANAGCNVDAPRACDPADPKKTTVCHIPPGNPANAHTICVGDPAVKAHLKHGDVLGECSCPGDDGIDVDAGASCPSTPDGGSCDGSGGGSDAGTCDHDTDGDGEGDCPDDGGGSGSGGGGSGSGDGSLQ